MDLATEQKRTYDELVVGSPFQKYVEPRRINPPAGYHSVHQVAAMLYRNLGEARLLTSQSAPTLKNSVVTLGYAVMAQSVPIYFVAEPFIRAVAATEMPRDIWIKDLHWPRPAMVLGFPRRFMQEYCGQDISYVACANIAAGVYGPPVRGQGFPTTEVPYHRFSVSYALWNKDRVEASLAAWRATERIAEAADNYTYTDMTGATKFQADQLHATLNRVAGLVMKLLLILGMRTSYVVEGGLERPEKIKHGKIKHCAIYKPNIIGGVYRMKMAKGGTHASPNLHWRRGHISHQVFGGRHEDLISAGSLPRHPDGEIDWSKVEPGVREKFWQQHRRTWIEAVLVGGPEDDPEAVPEEVDNKE